MLIAGNHRVDRGDGGPDHLIIFIDCYKDMMSIWDKCPEKGGGWIDTPSGTVRNPFFIISVS